MTPDPVRGESRRLATFEDRADELRREKRKGQHLAEILHREAIAGGYGRKVLAVAEGRPPLFGPRDVGDQNVIACGLRRTDDEAGLDAAAPLGEWTLGRTLRPVRCRLETVGVPLRSHQD